MNKLILSNGMLITPLEERIADIWTQGEQILGLGKVPGDFEGTSIIDATDCYVSPGLFDLQVNGGPGCDFWAELKRADVLAFSSILLAHGVTAILPTFITGDINRIQSNRDFLKREFGVSLKAYDKETLLRMPGIHLEGPCLSPERPGVHPKEYLQPLNIDILQQLVDDSVKLITLAPELDLDGKALKYLQEASVLIAIGHSNANFEQAQTAFKQGVSLMTHTFNALPSIHHRNPGAITAALLDDKITCCMICDGLHIDRACAELIYKCKKESSTILVTDIAQIGTNEGGLVGSSIYLNEAVKNVVQWGISSFRAAIRMASYNPAKLLGMEAKIGHLTPGAYADLLVWDRKTLELKHIIFNGQIVDLKVPQLK